MWFNLFFLFVIIQRVAELFLARRNEMKMRAKGAIEVGRAHYKWIVMLHIAFFLSLWFEVTVFRRTPPGWWPIPFTLYIIAQMLRIWTISSLGPYWNTKIIILPGASVIAKGPYLYLRHPNYLVVCIEIIVIPLLFQAYFTAILFTVFNASLLSIRIPEEERALEEATNYKYQFSKKRRFLPGSE
ncbi:isoprenylcysteine carboxyl methyltransferase family protein [Fictibacillus gelatini]|uniref:isoprenylcysteine carboxyl methyltransferase family protein n=1 Tax=Fictibacillus gelatini TaxID=225985 RepID=UPI0003FC5D1F|nr:isoprenylcysteine carboxylmethyltransferase family protein [Fictibacillus gelatini]